MALNLPGKNTISYLFDKLLAAKRLMISPPIRCRGLTADILFLVGQKRQWKDTKYKGLMSVLQLLGILCTRGRTRVYFLFHDLTHGMDLPARGKNIEERSNVWSQRHYRH